MHSDFAGAAANSYARYRRDLPADQTASLAVLLGLGPTDVVIDLGCGTGQIGVPLLPHAGLVVGVDPEPDQLVGLRARHCGIVPVLGDDMLLPMLGRALGGVGAVVIGNALHWMDEPAALALAAGVLRPGGSVAVITQGPPLWLGSAAWQLEVRRAMQAERGPLTQTCGADDSALAARAQLMRSLGLKVETRHWVAEHPVDADWVIGHLRSAMGDRQPRATTVEAVRAAVGEGAVERVTTTVIVGATPV